MFRVRRDSDVRAAPAQSSPAFFVATAGRLVKTMGPAVEVAGHGRRVPLVPRGWIDADALEPVDGAGESGGAEDGGKTALAARPLASAVIASSGSAAPDWESIMGDPSRSARSAAARSSGAREPAAQGSPAQRDATSSSSLPGRQTAERSDDAAAGRASVAGPGEAEAGAAGDSAVDSAWKNDDSAWWQSWRRQSSKGNDEWWKWDQDSGNGKDSGDAWTGWPTGREQKMGGPAQDADSAKSSLDAQAEAGGARLSETGQPVAGRRAPDSAPQVPAAGPGIAASAAAKPQPPLAPPRVQPKVQPPVLGPLPAKQLPYNMRPQGLAGAVPPKSTAGGVLQLQNALQPPQAMQLQQQQQQQQQLWFQQQLVAAQVAQAAGAAGAQAAKQQQDMQDAAWSALLAEKQMAEWEAQQERKRADDLQTRLEQAEAELSALRQSLVAEKSSFPPGVISQAGSAGSRSSGEGRAAAEKAVKDFMSQVGPVTKPSQNAGPHAASSATGQSPGTVAPGAQPSGKGAWGKGRGARPLGMNAVTSAPGRVVPLDKDPGDEAAAVSSGETPAMTASSSANPEGGEDDDSAADRVTRPTVAPLEAADAALEEEEPVDVEKSSAGDAGAGLAAAVEISVEDLVRMSCEEALEEEEESESKTE